MNPNLVALRKAEEAYSFQEQQRMLYQLIGALSSYVDPKTWNEALQLIYTRKVPNVQGDVNIEGKS